MEAGQGIETSRSNWVFDEKVAPIPLRFLTVDVQMDHFWLVVRAWNSAGSSRLLYCAKVLVWEEIEAIQQRFRVHSNLVFVDAGYNSFEVYRSCAQRGWTALMGDNRATFAHKAGTNRVQRFYSPVRKIFIARGLVCRMHFWSNLSIKDTLARLRRNSEGGPLWEIPEDVPEEYLVHLESEHRVKKGDKWQWNQIGKRPNHLLDCEAMNITAAYMLKIVGKESLESFAETEEIL
jgi:hypothetical protein